MEISNSLILRLTQQTKSLESSFKKLASGSRLTKAADGPAEIAVAEKLGADIVILSQGSKNIDYGQSAIAIADGALEQVGNIDTRLAELATQSSNGTLSDDQRASLNQEFQSLSQERNRIVQTTTFNDTQLLNSGTSVNIATGSGDPIAISFGDVNTTTGLDISTQAGAQAALDQVKTEITSGTQTRATLGASDSRLSAEKNAVDTRALSLKQAQSTIRDLDVAEETAKNVATRIQQRGTTALLAQANQSKKSILDFLA